MPRKVTVAPTSTDPPSESEPRHSTRIKEQTKVKPPKKTVKPHVKRVKPAEEKEPEAKERAVESTEEAKPKSAKGKKRAARATADKDAEAAPPSKKVKSTSKAVREAAARPAAETAVTKPVYPTPLPDNPFGKGIFHQAYNECLALEATYQKIRVKKLDGCPEPIVCARLLGHLLRLAPARDGLAKDILDNKSNQDQLMRVANLYVIKFISVFRRGGGPTPRPTEHPSRPAFEDARNYNALFMEERAADNRAAWAAAKLRDNNRCILSGQLDAARPGGVISLQAAHIIPASVNENIQKDPSNGHHAAGVWSMLSMFGQQDFVRYLAGNLINRLENIISLGGDLHIHFDTLRVWLRPVEGRQHTYRVYSHPESIRVHFNIPNVITFTTSTEIPLPNPNLLALHALCCEVAWMSGAAEYVMDIERRLDDTRVLAKDGSSVDILMTALSFVQPFAAPDFVAPHLSRDLIRANITSST